MPLTWSGYTAMVIRTDFDHEAEWARVTSAIVAPQTEGGFTPNVTIIDDREYDGLTAPRLLELMPEGANAAVAFLVDTRTLVHPDLPVLAINLFDYQEDGPDERRGPQFGHMLRVVPAQLWSVENNLSLSNMDWREFAGSVDRDGVFRGFGR